MARQTKKTKKVAHRSYYPLSEVKEKINNGQLLIRPDASHDAWQHFGWEYEDIIKAYRMLSPSHFYGTDYSEERPGCVLDFYKAHIMVEDIYTHFYIDDSNRKLVINSLKQDNTR